MKIGIVLAGGLAKGAYQIGVLKAIRAFFPDSDIKYISCSSVGILNGYSFAAGKIDKAEYIWRNICKNNEKIIFSKIINGEYLKNAIEELCSEKDDIFCSLYSSVFDLQRKAVIYENIASLEPKERKKYIYAGISIPFYSKPVTVGGKSLFDGAFVDNIPIYPLISQQIDYIFCVYFDDCCYTFENEAFDNKIIKLVYTEKSMFIFSKNSIDEMIDKGYSTTYAAISGIMKNGSEDREYISDAIKRHNSSFSKKRIRITGDFLLSQANRVSEMIMKKEIGK